MSPDNTAPNTPLPTSTQAGTRPAAKTRHKPIERFPLRFHCAITSAMGDALKRLTGNHSLLSESDVGRLALHSYLLSADGHYARLMRGGGNGNA
jgi:hypothetical protein